MAVNSINIKNLRSAALMYRKQSLVIGTLIYSWNCHRIIDFSHNGKRRHGTIQELTVKSELKYEEQVTLKFNIALLALLLSSDLTL